MDLESTPALSANDTPKDVRTRLVDVGRQLKWKVTELGIYSLTFHECQWQTWGNWNVLTPTEKILYVAGTILSSSLGFRRMMQLLELGGEYFLLKDSDR